MSESVSAEKVKTPLPAWIKATKAYEQADTRKALWQLVNTLVPYALLWYLMIRTIQLGYSYWLTLALAVPAGGLLVRIFIFFHDAGHGSFFTSRTANTLVGYLTGILTFSAYEEWRHNHGVHHATAGNLDRRGVGDVWTMTVAEYQSAPWQTRLAYRCLRHPAVLLILGPLFSFLIKPRFPGKNSGPRQRLSIYLTDLAVAAILVLAGLTIGLRTYVLVQLPILMIGGAAGVWLFYIQHQFQGVYWARQAEWDPLQAALRGSSYYRLPKVLQWFSGNIGLHHLHHIRPRIPNYHLQACYDAIPELQAVTPLTLRTSLQSLWLNLYDEQQQRMVSFRAARAQS